MDIETLKEAGVTFKQTEGRASYYDIALEIIEKTPFQAVLIIMVTWNGGRWRFKAKDGQNVIDLRNAVAKGISMMESLKGKDFETVNFDEIETAVKEIYSLFSKVEGVEYTGASKAMHLLNPKLFVMWDQPIRDHYRCATDANGYLNFQKKMQIEFKGIEWSNPEKTFAKAIDEYNQATITFPYNEKKYGKSKK
jgi:hypothetical protein